MLHKNEVMIGTGNPVRSLWLGRSKVLKRTYYCYFAIITCFVTNFIFDVKILTLLSID